MDAPSLEVFQTTGWDLEAAWCRGRCPCLCQWGWNFQFPFINDTQVCTRSCSSGFWIKVVEVSLHTGIACRFLNCLGVFLDPHPNPSDIIRRAWCDSKCKHQIVSSVSYLESSTKALHCQFLFAILEDLWYCCEFIYQFAWFQFLLSRAAVLSHSLRCLCLQGFVWCQSRASCAEQWAEQSFCCPQECR